jgi:hypothetical protein
VGGSGGAAGGSVNAWAGSPKRQAGGSGAGGGGSIAIIVAGPIVGTGGVVDASGGDGGRGMIVFQSVPNNWRSSSGGGGGGAGGCITLISGDAMNLAGMLLDARGGAGGVRSSDGQNVSCTACNSGGDGGKGFIFLMDSDGTIGGMVPGLPGQYDSFANGVLTISTFDATRFSSISAITEVFHVLAANPEYRPMLPGDVLAVLHPGQRVRIFVSSAKADAANPLVPDLPTETVPFEVALAAFAGGAVNVTITGDMAGLNPSGTPARDAYARVDARFEYDNPVEAALGPFAGIDRVTLTYRFNG